MSELKKLKLMAKDRMESIIRHARPGRQRLTRRRALRPRKAAGDDGFRGLSHLSPRGDAPHGRRVRQARDRP